MKTIALIDTHQGGHHLTYLRFFSKSLLELGYRVMTFCPNPTALHQWISQNCPSQAELFQSFEVQEPAFKRFPIIRRLSQPLNILTRWRHAAATIQDASVKTGHPPDLVFFAWIDSYLSHYLTHHIIDRIFPYRWSGIYFQPPHELRLKQLSTHRAPLNHYAVLQSSRCQGIAVLNEDIAEALQSKLRNPVITFPDIADESPPDLSFSVAQQIREKASDRKVIGLLGNLSKRKGFLTLLEAAQKAAPEDLFFVFAGPFSKPSFSPSELAKIQAIIQSAPPNCLFHFEYIPDEPQLNALIQECDILFAAYHHFPYSSNTLTKASVFNKPVIVSAGFCMGARVQRFRLGLSIPEGNAIQCIEALHKLCDRSGLANADLQPDFAGYKQLHSIAQLKIAFQQLLANF